MHTNARLVRKKIAELIVRCEEDRPDIIIITETWLDLASVPNLVLPRFECAARRDRDSTSSSKTHGGGVAIYRRDDGPFVSFIANATVAERSWCTIHLGIGPHLLCGWYRPSDQAIDDDFEQELGKHSEGMVGVSVVGDLNLHHQQWLKYSSGTSSDGELMFQLATKYNLKEYVRAPTRQGHLLDLFLSSSPGVVTRVLPKLADHAVVFAKLPCSFSRPILVHRIVWDYKRARWSQLRRHLGLVRWHDELRGDTNQVTEHLVDIILTASEQHIPQRRLTDFKSAHPWMNDRCRAAVASNIAAEGQDHYNTESTTCSAIIREEYVAYTVRLKDKLAKLPRNSKQWWQINRELMNNTKPKATIPPLKFETEWLSEPQSKADCLAKVFRDRCMFPAADGDPAIHAAPVVMNDFVPIRRRDVVRVLKALDPSKATGSDKIPAKILKECAVELSIPIMRLVRQMIAEGSWPAVWRRHLVAPIHKKKAKSDPNNYRGVHIFPSQETSTSTMAATITKEKYIPRTTWKK